MKYNGSGTAPAMTRYADLKQDPIRSITDTLIYNIKTKNYRQADLDYGRLLTTIRQRGQQGKDIRYVERELKSLRSDADDRAKKDFNRIIGQYLGKLPNPRDRRRIRKATNKIKALESLV